FFLLAEGFLLVPRIDAGEGGLWGRGDIAAAPPEQAALAGCAVAGCALAGADSALDGSHHGSAGVAAVDAVEGAALDEGLDGGLVDCALGDALAEVEEGGEGAGGATERRSDGGAGAGARRRRLGDGGVRFSAVALLDDRRDGGGAGALDRPQPETHVPVLGVAGLAIFVDHGEVGAGEVDVGGEHFDTDLARAEAGLATVFQIW